MSALTPSQQVFVDSGREALTISHKLDFGAASEKDFHLAVGRLEIALAHALRVIDELTEAE